MLLFGTDQAQHCLVVIHRSGNDDFDDDVSGNARRFLAFIVLDGGEMLSLTSLLKVIVGIALNVVLFSIGAYGISLGLRSSKGWSTLASISGTLVGFLGGVYLPMGFLPKGVASVLKFLPFCTAHRFCAKAAFKPRWIRRLPVVRQKLRQIIRNMSALPSKPADTF